MTAEPFERDGSSSQGGSMHISTARTASWAATASSAATSRRPPEWPAAKQRKG